VILFSFPLVLVLAVTVIDALKLIVFQMSEKK